MIALIRLVIAGVVAWSALDPFMDVGLARVNAAGLLATVVVALWEIADAARKYVDKPS